MVESYFLKSTVHKLLFLAKARCSSRMGMGFAVDLVKAWCSSRMGMDFAVDLVKARYSSRMGMDFAVDLVTVSCCNMRVEKGGFTLSMKRYAMERNINLRKNH